MHAYVVHLMRTTNMNEQVTAYINAAPDEQKNIMTLLRQLLHQTLPGLQEEFKWSRPIFRTTKDVAYFKTAKAYVTLGFFDFASLDDPHHLLEGTGKDMRHIKLKTAKDIDTALLKKWFVAAAS